MHDESIYAERALRARANGYIMKQEATEKVLVAVRRILSGDIYVSDRMANKMLHQFIGGSADRTCRSRLSALSDRELEVFRLIGEGRSTRQIAEELHLSIKTVETYQAHIKDKLSLRSGRELVQHAIQSTIGEKCNATDPAVAHRSAKPTLLRIRESPMPHRGICTEEKIGPVLLVSRLQRLFFSSGSVLDCRELADADGSATPSPCE